MRYLYCPCRCEFFPITQQDICPVTQPDNRNSLVGHLDTCLSYRMPGCVTGIRLRNWTSCASVRNIYTLSPRACSPQASGVYIRQTTHAHGITNTCAFCFCSSNNCINYLMLNAESKLKPGTPIFYDHLLYGTTVFKKFIKELWKLLPYTMVPYNPSVYFTQSLIRQ